MSQATEKPVQTLILGNGYDISLGLKTKYSDFINEMLAPSNQFTVHAAEELRSNNLFHYLVSKSKESWIDAEYELEQYVKEKERYIDGNKHRLTQNSALEKNEIISKFRLEYDQLKTMLRGYLFQIESDKYRFNNPNVAKSKALILTEEFIKIDEECINVINFNYTNSFEVLYHRHTRRDLEDHIYYVHGNFDSDIVFGIDDRVEISKDFVFALKSFDKNTLHMNYNTMLYESDIITFFGYSLGKTDESYFKDFFLKCCEYNENQPREINFYHKGKEGYQDLFFRLREMTENNTAKFLQYNSVEFIDVDGY
jgi:hypothetical protein